MICIVVGRVVFRKKDEKKSRQSGVGSRESEEESIVWSRKSGALFSGASLPCKAKCQMLRLTLFMKVSNKIRDEKPDKNT